MFAAVQSQELFLTVKILKIIIIKYNVTGSLDMSGNFTLNRYFEIEN